MPIHEQVYDGFRSYMEEWFREAKVALDRETPFVTMMKNAGRRR